MMAQNVPPPPLRGSTYGGYPVQQQLYPPPPPQGAPPPAAGFHTYADYAACGITRPQELAVRRADPMWLAAYGRAAMQADSGLGLSNEWNWYHGGDRMVSADLAGKLSFVPGVALVGDAKYTNVRGNNVRASRPVWPLSAMCAGNDVSGNTVRLANGTIANSSDNVVTGATTLAIVRPRYHHRPEVQHP